MKYLSIATVISALLLSGCVSSGSVRSSELLSEKRVFTSQFRPGLTYEQTKLIMGRNPDEVFERSSNSDYPNAKMRMYLWRNAQGYSLVRAEFADDKLISYGD